MILKSGFNLLVISLVCIQAVWAQDGAYTDKHRPQIHFSPKKGWMNDPNGMVYLNGKYHLFYQHNPDSTVWGPMHWGHAVSPDLVHWQELPIALYPDALGTIFSGSIVIDKNNSAGFGANAMVAIYTSHNHAMEKEGFDKIETQSIAYSIDEGKTWTKFKGNPVLPNPGIRDFRDPKVMWHEPTKKWIMTLAVTDHIDFYSSPDLKNWSRESDFGKNIGAHGGVWECPDLFPLSFNGEEVWVLIVSINPGGPNKGSATQYFTGKFDGHTFTPHQTNTKWLDYGPDDYAGITWSNTGERKVFLGWMSNWMYANILPTEKWRSANSISRELAVIKEGDQFLVTSKPVKELQQLITSTYTLKNKTAKSFDITSKAGKLTGAAVLSLQTDAFKSFQVELFNSNGEKLIVGYDKAANNYFIDRSASGKTGFHKEFADKLIAPRLSADKKCDITLVIDDSSVELFADAGISVMTAVFFPQSNYTDLIIQSTEKLVIRDLVFNHLSSIWK